MNNKGFASLKLMIFIFFCFFLIMFLGIGLYIFTLIDISLDQDVSVGGNLTLSGVNDLSFGKLADAFADQADNIGVLLLFAMVILMLGTAFYVEPSYPKFALVIDFLILFFAFILAVYVSDLYSVYINSTDLFSFYQDDLPKSSTFILRLPLIITVVWCMFMIINYSGIKKQSKESVGSVLGYG